MTHLLVILLLAVNNFYSNTETQQTSNMARTYCQSQSELIQTDSLLVDIQIKIYGAFVKGRITQSNDALNELGIQLENLYKVKNQNLILYWLSYLKFYSSINYLSRGDSKSAENEVNKGIEVIKSIGKKSSEDYVVLAMLQGISIQFDISKAMFISEEINNNISSAISLDSLNLRAWYVLASNDFYTPEEYGGGNKAEKCLLKAISLPVQKINNSYLPSWGKEESYEILIKFYIKNAKRDLAKKYFQEAIAAFPKSYTINQLAPQLTGK
jgi:hypothetical protein